MTTENNKLIAEFMGYEILYRPYYNGFIEISDTELCDVDDLEYHTSWDWLMPVIEKIQDKHLENPKLDYDYIDEIRLAVPNIQEAYYLVLEFINEYNN
jgi:hypothetical protein